MDLLKILQKISEEYKIPLQPTERGQKLQGSVYFIEYRVYPRHLAVLPRIQYFDRTVFFDGSEKDPFRLAYSIRVPYLAGQMEFLQEINTDLSTTLINAFQDAEKEPRTFVMDVQGATDFGKEFGELFHTRFVTVPSDKELSSFIKGHMRLI